MRRTNIVLQDIHYEYLKHLSEQAGKSMSAILRSMIDAALAREARSASRDPIHSVIGLGRSKKGRRPGRRHDELLYKKR